MFFMNKGVGGEERGEMGYHKQSIIKGSFLKYQRRPLNRQKTESTGNPRSFSNFILCHTVFWDTP